MTNFMIVKIDAFQNFRSGTHKTFYRVHECQSGHPLLVARVFLPVIVGSAGTGSMLNFRLAAPCNRVPGSKKSKISTLSPKQLCEKYRYRVGQ